MNSAGRERASNGADNLNAEEKESAGNAEATGNDCANRCRGVEKGESKRTESGAETEKDERVRDRHQVDAGRLNERRELVEGSTPTNN